MHVEDEYLDGSKKLTIEGYLKGRRRSSIRQTTIEVPGIGRRLSVKPSSSGSTPAVHVRYSSEPFWEKDESNDPIIPQKWKENSIDKRFVQSTMCVPTYFMRVALALA